MLLCGAVAFLWERERIGNEEVMRYIHSHVHHATYVHVYTCTCTHNMSNANTGIHMCIAHCEECS